MSDFLTGPEPLPGDWKIIHTIKQMPSEKGCVSELHIRTVASDRFNVVLEGSWPWIMQRIGAYMMSANITGGPR